MRIVKETPTHMTVKFSGKNRLLIFGVLVLLLGSAIVFLIGFQPLGEQDFAIPSLYQQIDEDSNPEEIVQSPTTGDIGFELAYYTGEVLLTKGHPLFFSGLLGIIVGIIILVGPHRSQTIVLDKSQQEMTLKKPRWFFRSTAEVYDFQDVTEVRVERDRTANRHQERCCRVHLVVSHSEGVPLTPNYIQYVQVYPLSEAYRYNQQQAQEIADRIRAFLKSD
jgi:hypothetical protein